MERDGIFRFRRALPADKDPVEALCAKIYELPLEKLAAYRYVTSPSHST